MKFTRLFLLMCGVVFFAIYSSPSNAVVLWVDDWLNNSKHNHWIKSTDTDHRGGKFTGTCDTEKPVGILKRNNYLKWCKGDRMHTTGFAIPWYKKGNTKFYLHRSNRGTVAFWVSSCGGKDFKWDCLHAQDDETLKTVAGFPLKLGPKGSCSMTMQMIIQKNNHVVFQHVEDKFKECGTAEKWSSSLAKAFLKAAPAIASILAKKGK